jgi:hypothetical protein
MKGRGGKGLEFLPFMTHALQSTISILEKHAIKGGAQVPWDAFNRRPLRIKSYFQNFRVRF